LRAVEGLKHPSLLTNPLQKRRPGVERAAGGEQAAGDSGAKKTNRIPFGNLSEKDLLGRARGQAKLAKSVGKTLGRAQEKVVELQAKAAEDKKEIARLVAENKSLRKAAKGWEKSLGLVAKIRKCSSILAGLGGRPQLIEDLVDCVAEGHLKCDTLAMDYFADSFSNMKKR
jgi:hypothetical protein